MTHRPGQRKPRACSWCGAPTSSETTFNGREIPLCETCLGRLRDPQHRPDVGRCLGRRFPLPAEAASPKRRETPARRRRSLRGDALAAVEAEAAKATRAVAAAAAGLPAGVRAPEIFALEVERLIAAGSARRAQAEIRTWRSASLAALREGADSLPSPRSELAAAVRRVNAAFHRLPESGQGGVDLSVDALEHEVAAAADEGNRERALAAVRAWEGHQLAAIERAGA